MRLLVRCAIVFPLLAAGAAAWQTVGANSSNAMLSTSPQISNLHAPSSPVPDSTELEPLSTPNAIYPQDASKKNIEGQVLVRVVVSDAGNVEKTEVVSGESVLAKAAVDAAKNWTFKPFIKNGKPTQVATKIRFSFAIAGDMLSTWTDMSDDAGGGLPLLVPSGVAQGLAVHKVPPVYPGAARMAHLQGSVRLRAIIGSDGSVQKLTPISGSEMFIGAAMDAVKQWRYKPYTLDGRPVAVETVITVIFRLS